MPEEDKKRRLADLVRRINRTSNADFVQRLFDRNRTTIPSNTGDVMTHRMGYVTDGDNAVVFPDVQSIGTGNLLEFYYPRSYERAVENGDTLHMSVPDAELFTARYKEMYPGFEYGDGGGIHIKPENRGKFTALKERTGHSASWFKENGTPAQKKMAVFALNAAKWKHADGGPIDFTGLKTTNNRKYNPEYISYISDSLQKAGVSDTKRAAILANIIEESGGNPFALDDTGKFYGLLQWANERYAPTEEKDVWKEIDNQVSHIVSTLGNTTDKMSWTHGGKGSGYNSYKDAMSDFDSNDLATAMKGFTLGYVRPTGKMDSYNNRMKVAQQLYNLQGFRTQFDAGGFIQRHGRDAVMRALMKMRQSN